MVTMSFNLDGLEKLEKLFHEVANIHVQGGVMVDGDAVPYSLVWEWGEVRQPGPKTMWGVNPDGETRVMTKTAPMGFIRIHHQDYIQILREEAKRITWSNTPMDQWEEKLKEVAITVGRRCAQLISDSAPIDTGLLRASIQGCHPDDPILLQTDVGEFDIGSF
jgi:hypothetical protein